MSGSMTTWARLIAAVTLLVAAFVVAPAADAATCAPETPAAHALGDHEITSGEHSGKTTDDGVCAHGHCHHAQGERSPGEHVFDAGLCAQSPHDRPRDDAVATRAVDGLKRPPRG